jgi:hypothetical protein
MRVFEIQSDWAQGRRSGEEKLQGADVRLPADHPLKRRIEELKAPMAPLDEEERRLNRPAVNLAASSYYLDAAEDWFKTRFAIPFPLELYRTFRDGTLGRDGIERFFDRVKEMRPAAGAISPERDVSEAEIDAIRDYVLARHAMRDPQKLLKEAKRDLRLAEAELRQRAGVTEEEASATERDAPFVTSQKFGVFKDGAEVLYTDEKGNQNPRRYQSMREAEIAAEKVGGEARDLGKRADTEGFVNLALRNIVLDAIEMGYTSIAFATGSQVNKALRQNPESVAGKGNVKFYDDVLPKIIQKFVKKMNAGTLTKAGVGTIDQRGAEPWRTNTVLDMSPEFIERAKNGLAMMSRRNQTGGAIGAAMRIAGGEPPRKFKTEDAFFLGPAAGFPALLRRGRGQLKPDARNIREAARRAVQDVSAWLGKENRRFADYYENDWKATRGFLEAHYKRPLTDEEMRVARFLAGVTSPNTALAANITDMVMLLDHWMAKGNFDAFEFGVNDKGAPKGVTGPYEISGNSAPNKLKVIKSVEKIAERLGSWDAALEYMMQTDTIKNLSEEKKSLGYKGGVGEVGKVRRVVEYASGTSDVVPRLFMFGPKVGAYTMNALGDSRYTTVDLWESRFIRAQFKGMFEENTGLPVGEEEHDLFVRFGELFNEEWKKATGDDMQPSALQAVRWFYIIDTAKRLGYSKASTNETISNYTARSIESRLQRRGTDQTGRFSGDGSPQGRGVVGEISYSRRPESSDQLSRDRGGQRTAGVYSPLEGAPVVEGATGPDPSIVQVAEQYAKDNGINLKRQARYAMVDEERARRIAQAYEDMQHSPSDPTVAEAYENLIKQTTAQYKALESAGYRFWLFDENSDPYEGKPWRAMRDLRSNKQMGVFDTAAGFGTSDFDPSQNPLLADTGIKWPFGNPNGPLRPVLANDLFRAVHDAFGHGMEGSGFRAQGEENAWQAHVRLFTGSAVGALTSETRGQNSWLNFGPYAEQNKTANVFETKFADQKTGLMPSWTWTEGRVEDETLPTDPSTAMDPLTGERVIKSMMSMRRGVRGIKDEATLRYLDRFDEVLRATRVAEERTGTALADVANPYLGARLLQGNIAQQQLDAEARYADLLRRQHVAGISLDDMDRFLYAQHAEERNRYIARIDPTRPDGGSGMTNADAAAEIARVQRSGRLPVFERFADEWRMMLQEALDARIDAGLVRPEVYAAINAEYKRYVPLRGIAARDPWDADFEEMGPQYGRGLSTTGRGMPMAAGRRSEASGITSQVAYVHEDTIRRIARNDVGQRFLRMMRAINDRAWGEVVRPTRRIVVDGAVRVVHDPTWTSDGRHFGVYVDEPMTINGHDYVAGDMVVIRINNRRLADAMLQPSMDLRAWERGLRAVNNVWRYMTTGPANPAFAPVNMLRDVGTATLNNMVTRGFMDTAGMLSRWPLAFARVMRDEWLGNGNATGTYRRFLAAGGGQVYWKENDLDVKRTDFEALARRVERRDPNDRSLAKTLFGWYTAFFAAAETASRLAQFEQRLAAGDSVQTAALAGRDITVDFSKGGLAKPALNTWYVFLNAALQGNANIISGLIRNPVRAALTMPHLILFGYVMAAMARAMGGEDEERGQSRWDNLRDEDKTAKIFFFDPSGSGKYISLPMPYGYNVLVSAGVRLEAAINGTDRASDVIGGTFNDALAAFNPIGGSGIKSGTEGLLTSLAPTMARPIAEITANTDFAGRPIYREQMGRVQQPDSQMAFEFTPEGWRTLAQSLNSATGGDEFESGFVDASPDTLRYLAGYYLSGTGRLLDRLYTAMSDPSKAELNDIPIMRSFVGDAANDRRSVSRQYYEIANSLAPTALRVREVESPTSAERLQSAVEGLDPEKVALNEIVSKTENELRKLRQVSKGATPEQQEAIAAVRRALQTSVIKQKNLLDKASRTE